MLKDVSVMTTPKVVKEQPSISTMIRPDGSKKIVIFLNGYFGDTEFAIVTAQTLYTANPVDEVLFIINSRGGVVSTLRILVTAIVFCKAQVTIRASGIAASCGAYTLPYGSKLEVGKGALIMFHNASVGYHGNVERLKEFIKITEDEMVGFITKAVEARMLTEAEKSTMIGKKLDLYLTRNMLMERGAITA